MRNGRERVDKKEEREYKGEPMLDKLGIEFGVSLRHWALPFNFMFIRDIVVGFSFLCFYIEWTYSESDRYDFFEDDQEDLVG